MLITATCFDSTESSSGYLRTVFKVYKVENVHFYFVHLKHSGFGGLEVACWPLVPKFAGSHPAEVVGFLGRKNSSARLPSEGK